MNSILLVLLALFLGALLSLAFGSRPRLASSLGALMSVVGCGYGSWVALQSLHSGAVETWTIPWSLPNASLSLGLDPLSAFFLCPLFVLGALSACYGRTYLLEHAKGRSMSAPWAAYNLMLAAMTLVLVARHAIVFLFAWEVMSLAAYLLVSFDHQESSVRRASFVYLIAAHVGVTCLFALFLLLGSHAQSFEFEAIAATPIANPALVNLLFLLALMGFGAKAGMFPLHVWLPEAHAAAPTHVSALMSGVLVKLGIYGILRTVLLLGGPKPFWGPLLMVLGIAGAVVGIGCSLYQRDIKRLLAYSSVENVGLILLALGTAFWGITSNHPHVAALAMVGGLIHVWNHALMKGLLFLSAGCLAHRCHTRDLERMGGLYRRMPQAATLLFVGATAMAGLPPLNGFITEWLIYSGLMHGVLQTEGRYAVALLAAIASVSLVGAMAALSFVRLIGISLLGTARSSHAESAKEASPWMVIPAALLGATSILVAIVPDGCVRLFQATTAQLLGPSAFLAITTSSLSPVVSLNRSVLALLIAAVCIAVLMQSKDRVRQTETWGCGYALPTARMQYSGRAFSALFTSGMLPRALGPRFASAVPVGILPGPMRLDSEMADPLTRSIYQPFFERWAGRFVQLRFMQQGILHVYVLYILMTLLFGLAWSATMAEGFP